MAVSGAARRKGLDRKVNVNMVLWKSHILARYLVESMQQIIGVAQAGYKKVEHSEVDP